MQEFRGQTKLGERSVFVVVSLIIGPLWIALILLVVLVWLFGGVLITAGLAIERATMRLSTLLNTSGRYLLRTAKTLWKI